MKILDTLIDDIYDTLSVLCDGGHLHITDEQIDKFGEQMKEVIKQWARPEKRNQEFSLRLSNIGRPARLLWYEKRHNGDTEINPHTMIKFLYGHMLEEVALLLAELAGHTVTHRQHEVTVGGITGHMDSMIDGEVVDVKTASNFSYRKFNYGTLLDDDPFGYLAQLAGYESAMGTTGGAFLVINKETGQLCLCMPEELEKPNIEGRIKAIKTLIDKDEPPAKCYNPVPEGVKGNMVLDKNCKYCSYKEECWKDANDGNGLRVFQYANEKKYFTTVVAEPKVQEVLE